MLGFGQMISVSGGTLDSAIGSIALKRIDLLRNSIGNASIDFPAGTKIFHLNDSAIAVLDVDLPVQSMHADSQSIIHPPILDVDEVISTLRFLGASAKLHQETINAEHDNKIGPSGRTFVVLGNRWKIEARSDGVEDVNELQANLAFAEAYQADVLGNKVGFGGRCWDSLFVNDLLWSTMSVGLHQRHDICEQILQHLSANKEETHWPKRLLVQKKNPIEVDIFNRRRVFYALMSHHTISLLNVPLLAIQQSSAPDASCAGNL
ncbi:MAG TPA: hypothetical protein PKJ85_12150 [Nitrosomonas nitrosa]|nr:hypothetical protein [Nitrosomonas nitrosa]